MKAPLRFFVHWLTYGSIIDNARFLCDFLALARKCGAYGVELPFEPLMRLDPAFVGSEAARAGLREVALCCFFPKGGDADPLGDRRSRDTAFASLVRAASFMEALREEGVCAVVVDGPFAFQIARSYTTGRKTGKKLREFLRRVGELGERSSMVFCLECLRREENTVIRSSTELLDIVRELRTPYVKAHLDTFHIACLGEDQAATIGGAGGALGWLHASGTKRHTPGGAGDRVDWSYVATGVGLARQSRASTLRAICFEGFGPAFRRSVPDIGGEFPRDLSAEKAIPLARRTLAAHGIVR